MSEREAGEPARAAHCADERRFVNRMGADPSEGARGGVILISMEGAVPDGTMTEVEAVARFSRELDGISARGRAPDCAEQMAAIHAEHGAERARMRPARLEHDRREGRTGR